MVVFFSTFVSNLPEQTTPAEKFLFEWRFVDSRAYAKLRFEMTCQKLVPAWKGMKNCLLRM
jgi:hypothetical protein